MLLRWERSVLETTPLPLSPPPSPHPSHPTKEEESTKRHNSPLFEELSDEEFEETKKPVDHTNTEKGTLLCRHNIFEQIYNYIMLTKFVQIEFFETLTMYIYVYTSYGNRIKLYIKFYWIIYMYMYNM